MKLRTRLVSLFHASAITVFPFIFVHPKYAHDQEVLQHEAVHYQQQKQWAMYGLGVGLLFWFFLYLFVLPVGINPFRRKWESEAFRIGNAMHIAQINKILKEPPYYLWW